LTAQAFQSALLPTNSRFFSISLSLIFCGEFRSKCVDLTRKYQQFLENEFPGELIADSLTCLGLFFKQNRDKMRDKRLAISFFIECFLECGVCQMLLQIFRSDGAAQTPFINGAIFLLAFLTFLRPEFTLVLSKEDFISRLTALILSDELINSNDCQNAVCGLTYLLDCRDINPSRLEPMLLNFYRFEEVCRCRRVDGRLLPRIVRQAVQIGVDSQWHPLLILVLSSRLSFDSYSDIGRTCYHLVVLNGNCAVTLVDHGFLIHLLTVTFHEGLPPLREALMAARVAYVRLKELPEIEKSIVQTTNSNDLQAKLLCAIPWDRVRDALDGSDSRAVTAALELVLDTLPESIMRLQTVRFESEGRLIEKGFLPILENGQFFRKMCGFVTFTLPPYFFVTREGGTLLGEFLSNMVRCSPFRHSELN
jgi:hypothetical protein